MLCFLETPVLRFALLPYYRRFQMLQNSTPRNQFSLKMYSTKMNLCIIVLFMYYVAYKQPQMNG